MRNFRRLAYLTVLAVYFLIFVGGLVRVAGAGLGCPDWPKCFGRWIPPLSAQDIPVDVDPSTFNLTLAWIEYGNRLVGMSVGLLVLATALLALKVHRKEKRILYPALVAALLTAYQGWQGGQVVASELKPLIVSLHLFISFIIVSLLVYVAQRSHMLEQKPVTSVSESSMRASHWTAILWAGGLIQIVLGTLVRGEIQMLSEQSPQLVGNQLLARVGFVQDAHMIFGSLLAIATWVIGMMIMRVVDRRAVLARQTLVGLIILVIVQIGLGFMFLITGLTAVLQLFHLWISGLYIGLCLALFFGLRAPVDDFMQQSVQARRTRFVLIIAILIMAIGAVWVIHQAEQSRAAKTSRVAPPLYGVVLA